MATLHEELIFQLILPRVPARSLLRFKCVSKAWLSLISTDAQFIKTHLQHFKSLPPGAITLSNHQENHMYYNAASREHFVVDLPDILNDRNAMLTPVVSYDGLLLILRKPISPDLLTFPDYYICNPITRKFTKLPPPPRWWRYPSDIMYDSTTQHYKVVSWSTKIGCMVLTLNGRNEQSSWRISGAPFLQCDVAHHGVAYKGTLNWVAKVPIVDSLGVGERKKCVMLTMDIGTEEVKEIELPRQERHYDANNKGTQVQVIEMNGALCVVYDYLVGDFDETVGVHVWVLEDYLEHKWRKVYEVERVLCDGCCDLVKKVMVGRGYERVKIEEKLEEIGGNVKRLKHVNTLVSWDGGAQHGKVIRTRDGWHSNSNSAYKLIVYSSLVGLIFCLCVLVILLS
ncbi:hypothetical protein Scep_002811 [Stephania cephalantha]|uniref:F-box associated beta-propeller type 3 domain-containing protein n=1 Tax=Stephania cephalantha TaxID=152367 RepID=A0AAP0Q4Y4_9MAGN